MKIVTTIKATLTAEEVGNMLVPAVRNAVDQDGSLGKITAGTSKDLGGLAAEVNLTFEKDG